MAKFYYGGQAVMEGVMMRGQRHMAVAVRAPDGSIVIHQEALNSGIYRHPVMKLPFFRGLTALWDALGLGIKALMFSADVAVREAGAESNTHEAQNGPHGAGAAQAAGTTNGANGSTDVSKDGTVSARKEGAGFAGPAAWTSIAVALTFMVGLFFVLPVLAAGFITSIAGYNSSLAHNVVEAVIRLSLFLGYIWLIGKMRDIERVFGYHGAEHKTINAYEAGVELTPERVQTFTLLNPRCGTTYLLIVMLFATVVFVVIGKLPFPLMVLSRVVLVPVIGAMAYEFIRLMANLYDHAVVRAIMSPGLALQRMTTRPPDLSMIEVGIVALRAVLVADGVIQPTAVSATETPTPAEEDTPEAVSALA